MTSVDFQSASAVLLLLAHDMRNPTATVRANLDFVEKAMPSFSNNRALTEINEALADSSGAVDEIARALDNLQTIARWIAGEPPASSAAGDAAPVLQGLRTRSRSCPISVEVHDPALRVNALAQFTRVLDIWIENAEQHAPGKPIYIQTLANKTHITIEMHDKGRAIAPELRSVAFTPDGQHIIKTRVDGRYSRCLGLFAAKLHADAIGAALEADGQDGNAIFRLKIAQT